ncbi:MAG: type VI secretion system ATPase TssH, partial [Firmicutes bacterium]|nr:type VI secretion system ATPase TssH [Bacillota bacterium]
RVDDIVLFKPLTLAELKQIVALQLNLLRQRLAERFIELELTEAAQARLAQAGYDPVYGARPLKRYIQKELETVLARKLIAGELREHHKVLIDADEKGLIFTITPQN